MQKCSVLPEAVGESFLEIFFISVSAGEELGRGRAFEAERASLAELRPSERCLHTLKPTSHLVPLEGRPLGPH